MRPLKQVQNAPIEVSGEYGGRVPEAQEEERGPGIEDFFAILRRRKFALIVPVVVLFAASVVVAWSLPPLYRSTATILIEQQEIPPELVASTVTSFADERIQMTTQRVMTTVNLQRIIRKFNLYPELRKEEPIDVVAAKVRKNFEVNKVSANRGRFTATIAFNVSFVSESPVLAQRVATELASLYLEENLKTRTASAEDTTGFLKDESEK